MRTESNWPVKKQHRRFPETLGPLRRSRTSRDDLLQQAIVDTAEAVESAKKAPKELPTARAGPGIVAGAAAVERIHQGWVGCCVLRTHLKEAGKASNKMISLPRRP